MKTFKLGGRAIDPTSHTVTSGGEVTRLRPICWDVLMCLVERCGEIVSTDDLLRTIWTARSGEPAYVRKAVHEIRAALDDREGRIVKTVPKVGYIIESTATEGPAVGATSSSTQVPLVYGRLSSNSYGDISRRLGRKP